MSGGASASESRRLLGLIVCLLLAAGVLFARYGRHPDTATLQILAHAFSSPAGTDSTFYMQMGANAFTGPAHSIYRELFFEQHQKFIYPPSSLFLLRVLDSARHVHLSPASALLVLLVCSWVASLALGVWLYKLVRGAIRMPEAVCILLLGVLFLPIAEALYRGQIQLLLTCLWGLAVVLWARKKHGWSAVVLGLTCAFKPQLAIFLLWGVIRKAWRFTAVLGAVLACVAVLSVACYGIRNNLDYVAVLRYLSRHGEALWANQSFNGLLNRLVENGDPMSWNPTVYPPYRTAIYVASTALSGVVLVLAMLVPRIGRWEATVADFLFAGCSSVLISPIAWEHHYGYFYFLLVYLVARRERMPLGSWVLLCACAMALANRLPPLDHRMRGGISIISSYMLYSGLAVLALLWTVERKRRTVPPV